MNEKNIWINSAEGYEFESRFKTALKKKGFTQVFKDQFPHDSFSYLKVFTIDKLGGDLLTLKNLEIDTCGLHESFLCQPFGSQNYPDFIVISNNGTIFPIEVKFSKGNMPFWNGNLPKINGIYIFGNLKKRDVTFFKGSDVLPEKERCALVNFYNAVNQLRDHYILNYEKEGFKLEYGFTTYIRETYTQNKFNKNAITDFLKNPKRNELEQSVLNFISNKQ